MFPCSHHIGLFVVDGANYAAFEGANLLKKQSRLRSAHSGAVHGITLRRTPFSSASKNGFTVAAMTSSRLNSLASNDVTSSTLCA